jgi:lipoic acid synthetase
MSDWRAAKVDIATLGQYLPPSALHLPLHRFVEPAEFDMYKAKGAELGFRKVESAPLVRSSYHAAESAGAETMPEAR